MAGLRPVDLLLPFQRKFALNKSRFSIALWSRQTGKGFMSSFRAAASALTEPKHNWIIAAPTERQAFETLDKAKDWVRAAHVAVAESEEEIKALDSEDRIKAKVIEIGSTGSRIFALPGRPASLRGFSGSLILDEFAFFDNQREVWKAVYPVITNPMSGIKSVTITSTPAGRGDKFFQLCDENLFHPAEGRRIKWLVDKVTIHEAAKEWEAAGKLGGISAEDYVADIRAGLDEPEDFPQEYECEFVDTDSVLLSYELIAAAESTEASAALSVDLDSGRPLFCGIDFGRFHDLTVCWTVEKVADLLVTREVLVLPHVDTEAQVELLSSRIAASRRTCVDYTGPGIGFGDMVARRCGEYAPQKHLFGKAELCTFSAPFKCEMFSRLRQLFNSPVNLRIPVSQAIRDDLHEMRQIVNGDRTTYRSRRTAEGHADRCTALALAVRAASGPAGTTEFESAAPAGRVARGRRAVA